MRINQHTATCPECGKEVDERNFTLECDHCLSKTKE